MTPERIQELLRSGPVSVAVTAGDHEYDGWIISAYPKGDGLQWHVWVEDAYGRLFIHNLKQLRLRE